MKRLTEFVQQHLNDEVSRLILDRDKRPDIDFDLAVNCIESRRKLKSKVAEWYDEPELIFPLKLSAEQCSSSQTGLYKARLAATIQNGRKPVITDITGGFGVDSWYFSKIADKVIYCERLEVLCDAARHNFQVLGADNISILNRNITTGTAHRDDAAGRLQFGPDADIREILELTRPDIVYIDPARRGEGGRKVFMIEECAPDVMSMKDEIFAHCRHLLLKLSPMADITMVCERLGSHCREVHITSVSGECKELLVWMDREWNEEYCIKVVELSTGQEDPSLTFRPSEERGSLQDIATEEEIKAATILLEPGKALMKSGAFNLISSRYGLKKLARSTHYYIATESWKEQRTTEELSDLMKIVKTFGILRISPLNRREIKATAEAFPSADVTARNLPMDTDTLRKKLGSASSDRYHIFGLKSDTAGNLLIATSRH